MHNHAPPTESEPPPTEPVTPSSELATASGSPAWKGPSPEGMYAYTDPGALPRMRLPDGSLLPLRGTDVRATLQGYIARVDVTQTFRNDSDHPIEVVYTFPLPENAAVSDLRMTIADRIIESKIKRRAEAQAIFDQARADGHTAALLEQERPNIFTQSVTNIAPGEDIEVEIHYLQTLTYDSGEYEFVFPMVVGPRFSPGTPTGWTGGGLHPNTDQVPDGSRISPPVVGRGTRTGNDVTLSVVADAGHPIVSWTTPTHDVDTKSVDGRLHATLANHDTIPNRDFVLRYQVAGERARATAFMGPANAKGEGYFMLVVHPPDLDVDELVGRREFIFVVDRSGSMSGTPLGLAKETVRAMLPSMRPVDTFNVVSFASGTAQLFAAPRPANTNNLIMALEFLDGMRSGGGTMMANAVDASLRDDVERGFNRYVFFLTDGYIGNEEEIFKGAFDLTNRLEQQGQVARVFGIGIGSDSNHHLLRGLSEAGRGLDHYIRTRTNTPSVVNNLMHAVDRVVLTDLELSAASLRKTTYPSILPDLFASHPITVVGRYQGELPMDTVIDASRGETHLRIPITVRWTEDNDKVLSTLWGRAKVEDLSGLLWQRGDDAEVVEQITRTGLDHNIVTAYTSLIAVDRSRTVTGDLEKITMPTEVPEGVDPTMAGAIVYGSSERSFTQVVEMSSTVSRSSAGISLAGTTGAESKYTVEGANVNNPSFGTVGSAVVQEFIETEVGWGPSGPAAHARFGRPRGRTKLSARDLRRVKRFLRPRLRRCIETSPVYDKQGNETLTVTIAVDTTGRFEVVLDDGSLGSDGADECVRAAVYEAPWSLNPGESVVLPLRLSAI